MSDSFYQRPSLLNELKNIFGVFNKIQRFPLQAICNRGQPPTGDMNVGHGLFR